jgi:hypothetical protein
VLNALWIAGLAVLPQEVPASRPTPQAPSSQEAPPPSLGFQSLGNQLAFRVASLRGSPSVCALLQFRTGSDHDPAGQTGLATVVEQWLGLQEEALPETERLRAEARGPVTIVHQTVPNAQARALLEKLAALIDGATAPDEDGARRAIAAARKEIDDQAVIYPGPILRWRGQRALLAGTPGGRQAIGIDGEVQRLLPGQVRKRWLDHYRPRNARLVVLGGLAEPELEGLVREIFGKLAAGEAQAPAPAVHDSAPPSPAIASYGDAGPWKVHAPLVAWGTLAPEPGQRDFLAFAVASAILQARLVSQIGPPPPEQVKARLPLLHFAYWEGQRLLLIGRRGDDGDGLETVQGRLRSVVQGIQHGIRDAEIAGAARSVAVRLALPPYAGLTDAQRTEPRLLFGKAFVLAMAEELGWKADLTDAVGKVRVGDVQRVLAAITDETRWTWFAVLPGEGK